MTRIILTLACLLPAIALAQPDPIDPSLSPLCAAPQHEWSHICAQWLREHAANEGSGGEAVAFPAAPVPVAQPVPLPGFAAPAPTCAAYTTTPGLTGAFERFNFLSPATSVQRVSLTAGPSINVNFLPNSDCSVRWLSVIGGLQIGGGQSASSSASAFTLTPLAGIGIYNSLFRVLVGYDFLNVGSDLSGLLTGRFVPGNLALFVGSGLLFDVVPAAPTLAMREFAVARALPPGYVRW